MPPLILYKASAGSGKTYALTLEYLRLLLLHPRIHRQILAVTFTNKAAGEMKSRILSRLHELSLATETAASRELEELVQSTGLDPGTIRRRSGELLKGILNDYSGFSVGTIDKFFQSVIRSFANELGMQPGYNLELDHDRILSLAVDRLFQDLTDDTDLREWLIRFAEDQIEEGRSWNFRQNIINLGQQLFRESFQELFMSADYSGFSKEHLNLFIRDLDQLKIQVDDAFRNIGMRSLEAIREKGWNVTDFRLKERSPASLFLTAGSGEVPAFTESKIQSLYDKGKWLNKGAPADLDQLTGEVLMPALRQLHTKWVIRNSILAVKRNLYTLGILDDLSERVREYTRERNLFLIADSSRFLKGIIGSNPVPFIYERTGNRYSHLMLDEFQDTSRFQYDNFRPLIDHSLASGNSNLVVGDLKQSIYRWRNSDWNILAARLNRDFRHQELREILLDKNYRSREMIIRFNNSVFQLAPEILEDNILNNLRESAEPEPDETAFELCNAYEDAVQKIPSGQTGSGGLVEIELFPENKEKTFRELVCTKLPHWIEEILESGVRPGEIAILVRTRKEAIAISSAILEHARKRKDSRKFRIISDESLLLMHSPAVNLIIALIRYLVAPGDDLNNALLKYLCQLNGLGTDHSVGHLLDKGIAVESILPDVFTDSLDGLRVLSLFELTESLISIFGLDARAGDLPYVQAFQDLILERTRREPVGIMEFIDYWDQKGRLKGIHGSEEADAIKILTIHKAKGLEFKAVIVPLCDWEMVAAGRRQQILWCTTEGTPFRKIPLIPIHNPGKPDNTLFARDFTSERVKGYMDNLNLLYVAFTRARDMLYIGLPLPDKEREEVRTTADLVRSLLSKKPGKEPALEPLNSYRKGHTIRIGSCRTGDRTGTEEPLPVRMAYPVSRKSPDLRIRTRNEAFFLDDAGVYRTDRMYGNLMHRVFSRIRTAADIDPVLLRLQKEGYLSSREADDLGSEIRKRIALPEVRDWFSIAKGTSLYNERTLFCGDGNSLRPDRVMVTGKAARVVDFKFGMKEEKRYLNQVEGYMVQLEQLGYAPVEGFVWYVVMDKVTRIERS